MWKSHVQNNNIFVCSSVYSVNRFTEHQLCPSTMQDSEGTKIVKVPEGTTSLRQLIYKDILRESDSFSLDKGERASGVRKTSQGL